MSLHKQTRSRVGPASNKTKSQTYIETRPGQTCMRMAANPSAEGTRGFRRWGAAVANATVMPALSHHKPLSIYPASSPWQESTCQMPIPAGRCSCSTMAGWVRLAKPAGQTGTRSVNEQSLGNSPGHGVWVWPWGVRVTISGYALCCRLTAQRSMVQQPEWYCTIAQGGCFFGIFHWAVWRKLPDSGMALHRWHCSFGTHSLCSGEESA